MFILYIMSVFKRLFGLGLLGYAINANPPNNFV
ncbi:MAG: hypothetical protein BMS9Abin36_0775 [Gammaproteobacteria bacterium]|nr:MAG: hypothetical protein BMS9Abin36_0775 [Gammaproteobacteria bacterium]